MFHHTGGTYSNSGMTGEHHGMESWKICLFDGIFESWRLNFKTEVCMRTADPQVTVLWIKEVEVANPIDELVTSRTITGQHKFLDFDMQDAMIASALKKLINTQSTFRKRVSVEEQRAQNSDRFLRGRQNCVHDVRVFQCNRSL